MENNTNPNSTAPGQQNDQIQPQTANSPQISTNWDAAITPAPFVHFADGQTASIQEGGVYSAKVTGVVEETSKYNQQKGVRFKFHAFDAAGCFKPVSIAVWGNDRVKLRKIVEAIDPAGWHKPKTALVGQWCNVRLSLELGVRVIEVLPKERVPKPTTAV